jgi:hypothetical protein
VKYLSLAQQSSWGLGRWIVEISIDHTKLHTHTHTSGRTLLNEKSARRRGLYLRSTQQTQKTNIHALSEIRTRDPNHQAAADLRLRPHKVKVKQSHYRPGQALRFRGGWGSQISRQSAREGGKVVSPTHRKCTWYSFLLRGWVDPRAIVRPKGLCQWKIPMTPSGIEPATRPHKWTVFHVCRSQLSMPPKYGVLSRAAEMHLGTLQPVYADCITTHKNDSWPCSCSSFRALLERNSSQMKLMLRPEFTTLWCVW